MVLEHRRQRITLRRGCSAFNLHWHARHRAGAKIVFHRLHTWQGLRCTFGRGLVGVFNQAPEPDRRWPSLTVTLTKTVSSLCSSSEISSWRNLCVSRLSRRPFRCQCSDQCRIRTEEEITECQTPPVGDPALHQMVRPIVQHVAALTEGPQIFQPIVGGIAVQVRRCKHDAGHPEPSCLHKVGPTGRTSTAISPCRRLFVEPAPVWQAAEQGEMGSATALAPSSGALEADVAAQFAPVRGIEWSQLRADWHGYAAPFFPSAR